MLCPKCGREYEGSECPRCSGPKIVVNNSDYLKRKKAYEEKQAGIKSASSNNVQKDSDKAVNKNNKKKSSKKSDINVSANENAAIKESDAIDKMKEKGVKLAVDKAESFNKLIKSRKKTESFIKKHFKKILLILIIAVAVIAAAVEIYHLAIRKNYEMYMSSENGIYNVSNLESKHICNMDEAVFAADKKTFYMPEFPQDISKDNIVESFASDSGKYFSAVTYDENTLKYAIYLWNKDGCIKVAENTKSKDIKYVSDKGKLIYTDMQEVKSRNEKADSDEMNVEGGVSEISLYEYAVFTDNKSDDEFTGKQQLIDAAIQTVNVYTEKTSLVCLNKDGSLYLYDYEKMGSKMGIADDVSGVYVMSDEYENLYTYNTSDVNQLKSADGFIYTIKNICYYHEINGKEVTNKTIDSKDTQDLVFAKATGSSLKFIYEKSSGYSYVINSGKISVAKVEDKKMGEYTEAAELGAMSSGVYIPSESTYVFIDSQNNLAYINKGTVKHITEGITDGTLYNVENTQKAFTYVKNGVRYYVSSVSSKEIKLIEVSDTAVSNKIILYKKNLYFYKDEGRLYTCTENGKDVNEVGNVESFWLGTEYK